MTSFDVFRERQKRLGIYAMTIHKHAVILMMQAHAGIGWGISAFQSFILVRMTR